MAEWLQYLAFCQRYKLCCRAGDDCFKTGKESDLAALRLFLVNSAIKEYQ